MGRGEDVPLFSHVPHPRIAAREHTDRHHDQVPHPHTLLRPTGWSDFAADHLVSLIGTAACLWVFIVVPLATLVFPKTVQDFVFFLASGWIQLWALSAIVYGQNKADRKRDAKADADHLALTHIATQLDVLMAQKHL